MFLAIQAILEPLQVIAEPLEGFRGLVDVGDLRWPARAKLVPHRVDSGAEYQPMARRTPRRPDVLAALSPDEGLAILRALLAAHPRLADEARALATRCLVEVDRYEIAEQVFDSISALSFEDLHEREARHVYSYVEPTEVVLELLEEAIEPLTTEIGRLLKLGLEDAARAQCEGVLLGLQRLGALGDDHDILGMVVDYPDQRAEAVLAEWSGAPGGPRQLDADFLRDVLDGWWAVSSGVVG